MKVNDRQTLLDIALQVCGSAEGALELALLNNLAADAPLTAGEQLNTQVAVIDRKVAQYYASYDLVPSTEVSELPELPAYTELKSYVKLHTASADTLRVADRQTMLDVALIAAGSAEGALELALLNNLSLTAELSAEQELSTRHLHSDAEMHNYYAINHIAPATAIVATYSDGDDVVLPTGLGFMGIEIDFVVS